MYINTFQHIVNYQKHTVDDAGKMKHRKNKKKKKNSPEENILYAN